MWKLLEKLTQYPWSITEDTSYNIWIIKFCIQYLNYQILWHRVLCTFYFDMILRYFWILKMESDRSGIHKFPQTRALWSDTQYKTAYFSLSHHCFMTLSFNNGHMGWFYVEQEVGMPTVYPEYARKKEKKRPRKRHWVMLIILCAIPSWTWKEFTVHIVHYFIYVQCTTCSCSTIWCDFDCVWCSGILVFRYCTMLKACMWNTQYFVWNCNVQVMQ